ncbi:hypothetical protein M6B38_298580 [Iris pallida]|uniref:Uncharacterized protein n=1 Tax=Iris pallida TaxID=29817 RepID=A0AAX6HQD3_IRIPA|nr:hypothetical protein M6B38_298580 [Iris pallida]
MLDFELWDFSLTRVQPMARHKVQQLARHSYFGISMTLVYFTYFS